MKITRILIYEGYEDFILEQMSRSLPDGVREIGHLNKITVLTVGNTPMLELYKSLEESNSCKPD